MKPLFSFFALLLCAGAFAQDVIPLVKPSAWFKSDSLVVDSTIWMDISGNGHHMLPAANSVLPSKGYLNFNPCFVLDSLCSPMRVSYNFNENQRLAVLSVYEVLDTVNEQGIWTAHKGQNRPLALSTHRFIGERHSMKYAENACHEPTVSTLKASWSKILNDPTTQDTIFLGRNDSLGFNGKIAEFMVFNEFVSGTDLQAYRSYLCLKYGITLQKMNYLNSKHKIIWDTAVAPVFRHGIAGLARDTVLGLNQKQASTQSMYDILTITSGMPYLSNALNPSVINEGDNLIWKQWGCC